MSTTTLTTSSATRIFWALPLAMAVFTCGFVLNFPFEEKIQSLLQGALSQNPRCKVSFEKFELTAFLPGVGLKKLVIPSQCFDKSGPPLDLDYLNFKLAGPSFSPLGIILKAETKLGQRPLVSHVALGPTQQVISLQDQTIALQELSKLLPGNLKLSGKAKLNGRAVLLQNQLADIQMLIESKDFALPSQVLADLKIPALAIGAFGLKMETPTPRRLEIKSFILGDLNSPIRAKFSGDISLRPEALAQSAVNLKGEASFSDSFKNDFAILNLLLGQFTQKDGFYQIKLGGTLGQIKPMP